MHEGWWLAPAILTSILVTGAVLFYFRWGYEPGEEPAIWWRLACAGLTGLASFYLWPLLLVVAGLVVIVVMVGVIIFTQVIILIRS